MSYKVFKFNIFHQKYKLKYFLDTYWNIFILGLFWQFQCQMDVLS